MASAVYLAYAIAQLVLTVFLVRLYLRDRHWTLLAFAINVAGICYDNLAIGFGHLIGPGPTLMALNYPRYLIHATTTPLIGMLGLYLARNAGVAWAWGRKALVIFWAITIPILALAIYNDLIMLRLEPAYSAGTLRYANAAAEGPPLPAIVGMLMVLVCGVAIIIRARWPWLFLGALVMFVLAAAAASLGLVANLGEVAFVSGVVATCMRFPRLTREEFQRRHPVAVPAPAP